MAKLHRLIYLIVLGGRVCTTSCRSRSNTVEPFIYLGPGSPCWWAYRPLRPAIMPWKRAAGRVCRGLARHGEHFIWSPYGPVGRQNAAQRVPALPLHFAP